MPRLLSLRPLAVLPLAAALGLVASASRLDGQPPPMGPKVTINLPMPAAGGYTFDGSVITLGGLWTAGPVTSVQVTNKAGGPLIPTVYGAVNRPKPRGARPGSSPSTRVSTPPQFS